MSVPALTRAQKLQLRLHMPLRALRLIVLTVALTAIGATYGNLFVGSARHPTSRTASFAIRAGSSHRLGDFENEESEVGSVADPSLAAFRRHSVFLCCLVGVMFKAGGASAKLPTLPSVAEAKKQVVDSAKKLKSLLNDATYAKVIAGGGDSLRRELGTVNVTSPLAGLDNALKVLALECNDPDAFSEISDKLLLAVQAADADAYSSIFVEFSSAKGTKEQYFKKSKKEIQNADESMSKMLSLLGLA